MSSVVHPLHGKRTHLDRVRHTSVFLPANSVEVDSRKLNDICLGKHKGEEFLVERIYNK